MTATAERPLFDANYRSAATAARMGRDLSHTITDPWSEQPRSKRKSP